MRCVQRTGSVHLLRRDTGRAAVSVSETLELGEGKTAALIRSAAAARVRSPDASLW